MTKRIRTFIAAVLPENVKLEIEKVIQDLQKSPAVKQYSKEIKWVDPANLHITLVFMGHIGIDRVRIAGNLLEDTARNYSEFELNSNNLSYFFSDKDSSDSVILLDIGDKGTLREFYRTLADKLEKEAFFPPKRYMPHITIARLKKLPRKDKQAEVLEEITSKEIENIIIPISTMAIFESSRFEGQIYRMHKKVELKSKSTE